MTDRELLESMRRQQTELEQSLARLNAQLQALEKRTLEPPVLPPTLAPQLQLPPLLPILPPIPLPVSPALPPLPSTATAATPRPSLEFQFGRWLTRIGAVFGVVTLVLILSLTHSYLLAWLGPAGILGLSGAFCVGVVILALRMERNDSRFFARSLLALGLGGLYVTVYAAHGFDPVRIVRNPLLEGLLLLLWSIYVFLLAERKGSHTLALFAIVLAYFSTAINPVGRFSLAADLLLAGMAVIFLLRHGWAAVTYLGLFGTYFALFRRLVIDPAGQHAISFAPYAVYLLGAWVIFTAAVLLSAHRSFRGGNRLAFLSLNNAALVALLTLTAYFADEGLRAMGWTLLWTGALFLATAVVAGGRRSDPGFAQVSGAYLGQGLAVFTAGLISVCAGITRGVVLIVETFILGLGGTFSGGGILRIAAMITAFFAALFLGWEMNSHHPWLLGLGGAAVMLLNAWWARHNVRPSPLGRRGLVLASSYYCALALGLAALAMNTELSDAALPPVLAAVALILSFSVYAIPLYELPPLAQIYLVAAQLLVLFPAETGETLPRASTAWVTVLTLVMLAWWSRQRVTRYGPWIVALNFVYALALVGLSYHAVRPCLDRQGWMMAASLLSVAFLVFGAFTRVWPLAAMGQVFLAGAVYRFYFPGDAWFPFPWTWWAAAVPVATVLATGRAVHAWLREFSPPTPESIRLPLQLLAYGYLLLALAMFARLIFGVVPVSAQMGVFLFLGTLLLAHNAQKERAFGVRCSFILSALGLFLFVGQLGSNPRGVTTFLDGLAFFSLLSQPALLRHAPRRLVTEVESWLLILISAGAGWLFVHAWVTTWLRPGDLTLGWALYALFLFFFGLLMWERRQRWCGLAILAAAMVRVLCVDIWGLSNGFKVLTLAVLTAIALGLGYLYTRFHDRLKAWL